MKKIALFVLILFAGLEIQAQAYEYKIVTSGVESDAGKYDGTGIFITRFIFRRMN